MCWFYKVSKNSLIHFLPGEETSLSFSSSGWGQISHPPLTHTGQKRGYVTSKLRSPSWPALRALSVGKPMASVRTSRHGERPVWKEPGPPTHSKGVGRAKEEKDKERKQRDRKKVVYLRPFLSNKSFKED